MNWLREQLKDEKGLVLAITMMILGIFTILGVSAIVFSSTEMHVATNEKFHKIAFYGAEAGRGFVPKNTDLYGMDNVIEGQSLSFPNNADASEKQSLSSYQSFNGEVQYNGHSAPPRGSGYEVGTFSAHEYQMTCNGYGPYTTRSQIEAGFYRIGF
jgi:hypothetical protein